MNHTVLLALTCMLSVTAAYAESPVSEQQPPAESQQSATRAWLELQSSGRVASKQPQPLSGDVLDKVHKRYVDSFSRPIPERFDHESYADD